MSAATSYQHVKFVRRFTDISGVTDEDPILQKTQKNAIESNISALAKVLGGVGEIKLKTLSRESIVAWVAFFITSSHDERKCLRVSLIASVKCNL